MGEALDLHTQFLDSEEFLRLAGRLAIDLIFALILVFGIYARRHGKTEYVFTYVMFNLITFTLCFMLRQAEISIEFAHRVNILRVEVEVETAISDEYVPDRILPCLVLFKDGKMIERRYGTNPEMEPKEFLQTWLSENLED